MEVEWNLEGGWTLVSSNQHSVHNRYAQNPTRSLNRLTHLDVHGFLSSIGVGVMFSMVDAPSLNDLEVSILTYTGYWQYVINFLRRFAPPLERLKLSGTSKKLQMLSLV